MQVIHHNISNELLHSLDVSLRHEKVLRKVIDSLFLFICQHCTEEEIKSIECLNDLKLLAKGEFDN